MGVPMTDEIAFAWFDRTGPGGERRRVYAEVLTEEVRARLPEAERVSADVLSRQGHTVAALYERGGRAGLGFLPATATPMTAEEFSAALLDKWPPPPIEVQNETRPGGSLGLRVTRGDEPTA